MTGQRFPEVITVITVGTQILEHILEACVKLKIDLRSIPKRVHAFKC